jgi:2-iminobutanoate/2-iminopropanoate deaminase
MSERRSIEVEGLDHGAMPIPAGSRVGPLICSSGISGTASATGTLPADGREQVRLVFENLQKFLAAAGAELADVARVGVLLEDPALRDAVNAEWVILFPDPGDRPARHTTVRDLPGAMLVQIEVIAFCQSHVHS